jgi:hypothetical protein
VASSINHISGQATAVMPKAGRPVSIDDVSLLGHVIADWIVRDGFRLDEEQNVESEQNGGADRISRSEFCNIFDYFFSTYCFCFLKCVVF